jgi:hypothetical protein
VRSLARICDARAILPFSLHRPVAVTEGSLTRTLNETGVRLWTDCSIGPPVHVTAEGSYALGRPWKGHPFEGRSAVQKTSPVRL